MLRLPMTEFDKQVAEVMMPDAIVLSPEDFVCRWAPRVTAAVLAVALEESKQCERAHLAILEGKRFDDPSIAPEPLLLQQVALAALRGDK